ncbi:hypothetical protein QJS10_CPA06g02123 [Acorus calamus]|uniref:Phytocyanin domain-containing protein n=1 Tax=Acorus calamus TaxID=4465 RepID=A0AAV9EJC9_ACOCL|nr:hypothetical protein QJS10_CPA06g02123 [Acorus calamus]
MGYSYGAMCTLCATLMALLLVPESTSAARIIVGGSNHWQFGFNYADWAFRSGPFYQNDTLVFMYDPPSNNTPPHSVYLFNDFRSFATCNLKRARMAGNVAQGGGKGFEFVLQKAKPYMFACGEHDGIHCRLGLMQFFVLPLQGGCHA